MVVGVDAPEPWHRQVHVCEVPDSLFKMLVAERLVLKSHRVSNPTQTLECTGARLFVDHLFQ